MATSVIHIEGVDEILEKYKELTTSATFGKDLRKIIKKIVNEARKDVQKDAHAMLENDPRKAYKAVRAAAYRSVFGGNVNILNQRKAGKKAWESGAKHRPRMPRTKAIESYYGADRGFILRFVNGGTRERVASHMNNQPIRRTDRPRRKGGYKTSQIGDRGSIGKKDWFDDSSTRGLEKAAANMQRLIDAAVIEIYGK